MEFKLCKMVLLSVLAIQACAVIRWQQTKVAAKPDKILEFVKCLDATGQLYKWCTDVNGAMIVAPAEGDVELKEGKDKELYECIKKYGRDVPIVVAHITNSEAAGRWQDVTSESVAEMVEAGVVGVEYVEIDREKRPATNDAAYDMFFNQSTKSDIPNKCRDEENKIGAHNHCCTYSRWWDQLQVESSLHHTLSVGRKVRGM